MHARDARGRGGRRVPALAYSYRGLIFFQCFTPKSLRVSMYRAL